MFKTISGLGNLFTRKVIPQTVNIMRNNSQTTTPQRLNGKVAIVTASTEGYTTLHIIIK